MPLLGRPDLDLVAVKEWIAEHPSAQSRRLRATAARALFKWAHNEDIIDAPWWSRIPIAVVPETRQNTATGDDYRTVLAKAHTARDKAMVAVLWSSGMRREEVSRMTVEHLDLEGAHVVVPIAKSGRNRVAPLSTEAVRLLRRYIRQHPGTGPLWMGERGPLTPQGVRMVLRRLGAPAAHAWRRGWAVQSLRDGISQTSVQSAAGWSKGDMVTRYTRAMAGELAMEEFAKRWAG